MTNKILSLVIVVLISFTAFAQKGQRIGYVDMEYILENIPEYEKAQSQLNEKAKKWQQDLDQIKGEIETMKADLSNEKALLTEDLISERLENINIKEEEFKKLEETYFSSNGDLFFYRKQLVKPIQDQVFNAAQAIGKTRGYDIIFDKSSDVIMIYTNKKADISDLVLKSIVRTKKTEDAIEKRNARNNNPSIKDINEGFNAAPVTEEELSIEETDEEAEVAKEISDREAKKQAAIKQAEKYKAERAKKYADKKAEIERIRQEKLAKRLEARKKLKENKENSNDKKEDGE